MAARGIVLSYETVRQWCLKFGQHYAKNLRRPQGRLGDTWYLDKVVITIHGERHSLWRAVDQDGDVLDILVQIRRSRKAAKRFFRKLLKGQCYVTREIVTERLNIYGAAKREVMLSVVHHRDKGMNYRAEVSNQATRKRERQMRRFRSVGHAQRFLSTHGPINNLFRVSQHLLKATHCRLFRDRAFSTRRKVTCASDSVCRNHIYRLGLCSALCMIS